MKRSIFFIISILSIVIFGFVIHTPNEASSRPPIAYVDTLPIVYHPSNEIQEFLTPYDSIVEDYFESAGLVGAALVVTYKGEVAFTKCFGVRKEGEQEPIDAHTIFRLASVSKSVTGILASILDEKEMLKLDDKVVDFLPAFQLQNPDYTQQITIRNLLSQTSGVIPHAYDLMVEDKVPLDKIITYLNKAQMSAAPGKLYTYQNVVYSIYEPIIEHKLKKDFQQVMKENVFQPFGMNDASLCFESFKNNTNKAYPHVRIDQRKYACISLNDRYYNTAPAAGVNASITDMGHLLSNLSGYHTDVFSSQANITAFTPQISTNVRRKYFRSWGQDVSDISYGIGWRLLNYKGHKVAYHGGYVKGYKAEIALCNDQDVGIAILSNSPHNETSKCIPTFFNLFFDYKNGGIQQ